MFRTKTDRQLELFVRTSSVPIRIPPKTALKIKSLLADLLAGLWLSNKTSREEKPRPQRGQDE